MPKDEIGDVIISIMPEVLSFDQKIAITAGHLIKDTKQYGLSLGDRACIATSIVHELDVYTTDQAWGKLQIPNLSVKLVR